MKLKKIASLLLAGVMAVSMLTACGSGAGDNGNNGNDGEVVVTPETGIVAAVNNGQNADNDVKIAFTSSSSLDAALTSAVQAYGEAPSSSELYNRILALTGIKGNISLISNWQGMEDSNHTAHDSNPVKSGADGDVTTILETIVVTSNAALSEDRAMDMVAEQIDAKISDLKATSYKEGRTVGGNKYCDYDYTGNVSMVKVVDAHGVTSYCFAYTITQTISVKTLDR